MWRKCAFALACLYFPLALGDSIQWWRSCPCAKANTVKTVTSHVTKALQDSGLSSSRSTSQSKSFHTSNFDQVMRTCKQKFMQKFDENVLTMPHQGVCCHGTSQFASCCTVQAISPVQGFCIAQHCNIDCHPQTPLQYRPAYQWGLHTTV